MDELYTTCDMLSESEPAVAPTDVPRGSRLPVPRTALDTVRLRARLLRIAREQGLDAALGLDRCSRRSLFRWQARAAGGGLAALVPEPYGPRHPVARHPAWVEQVVIAVRLATCLNAKRIAAELARREIARVSHGWISQLPSDLGTARPSSPRERGPRYERAAPNALWHIDIKGPFFIQLARGRYLKTWLIGLVDDHSRYLLGLRIAERQETEGILGWLADCVELCGTPLDLMSDNGTPFVHWMPGVLTRFGKELRDLEIRHIRTQVDSPWTNGTIESLWATLTSEVLDREIFRDRPRLRERPGAASPPKLARRSSKGGLSECQRPLGTSASRRWSVDNARRSSGEGDR